MPCGIGGNKTTQRKLVLLYVISSLLLALVMRNAMQPGTAHELLGRKEMDKTTY